MSYFARNYGKALRLRPSYKAPAGFKRVRETQEELADYKAKHSGWTPGSVYMLECLGCGKRIWGSGIGIGSHRRACPQDKRTYSEQMDEWDALYRPESPAFAARQVELREAAKARREERAATAVAVPDTILTHEGVLDSRKRLEGVIQDAQRRIDALKAELQAEEEVKFRAVEKLERSQPA